MYGTITSFLNGTSAQLGYTVPFMLDVVKKI